MTPEQENIIYDVARQLQHDYFDVQFDAWSGGYICPLCFGSTAGTEKDFVHLANCPRILMRQLLQTLPVEDKT